MNHVCFERRLERTNSNDFSDTCPGVQDFGQKPFSHTFAGNSNTAFYLQLYGTCEKPKHIYTLLCHILHSLAYLVTPATQQEYAEWLQL